MQAGSWTMYLLIDSSSLYSSYMYDRRLFTCMIRLIIIIIIVGLS